MLFPMSASFWYKLAQNLLSEENLLVSRRVRNSLRFSPLYLYLGMKQALATIEAEFSNIRFPKLELEVDRRDEMYMHDHPEHYFYVAYSALACIQGLRTNQSGETFTSILDLPCGHGRVLRALKAAFYGLSPEQIEMVKLQYTKGGFGYADYRKNPGYGISLSVQNG